MVMVLMLLYYVYVVHDVVFVVVVIAIGVVDGDGDVVDVYGIRCGVDGDVAVCCMCDMFGCLTIVSVLALVCSSGIGVVHVLSFAMVLMRKDNGVADDVVIVIFVGVDVYDYSCVVIGSVL